MVTRLLAYNAELVGGECDDDEFATAIEEPARRITRSGWWIDNRDTHADDLLELITSATTDPRADTGCENTG